jgi:HAE1 family hydrophobic/amphiphilic exporter-1
MNLARLSVARPVLIVMVTLIVITVGGISVSRLPIDLVPDVSLPTLTVVTSYDDASSEEVEELITRPIEAAVSAIPGVKEVTSASAYGESSVRVSFVSGTDLDAAANDVRDRLDRITSALPDEADRPSLRKFDLASFPILILGASGRMDQVVLRRLIDGEVRRRLERIDGVAAVDVQGGLEREIHVDVDPDRLRALQIPVDQVLSRIRSANVNRPAGTVASGQFGITLRTPGLFETVESIGDVVVAERGDAQVQLRQIASVRDTSQKQTRIIRINGVRGIRLNVNKQSGTNTVEVAKRVRAEIDKINADMPHVTLTPIIDTSTYIERSVASTSNAALIGGVLAIVVLLIFLRSVSSTGHVGHWLPCAPVAGSLPN